MGILGSVASVFGSKQQHKSNAASYQRQSVLAGYTSEMYAQQAGMYGSAAKASARAGKANAKQERIRAGQVYGREQFQIEEEVRDRRAKVGHGKVSFASNGVLLDSNPQSTTAMWEVDEAADLAKSEILIMQEASDQVWGMMTSANKMEAEGYQQAAGYYGQAASAMGQSYLKAVEKNNLAAQAAAERKASHFNWIDALTIADGAMDTGIGIAGLALLA